MPQAFKEDKLLRYFQRRLGKEESINGPHTYRNLGNHRNDMASGCNRVVERTPSNHQVEGSNPDLTGVEQYSSSLCIVSGVRP